MLRTIVLLSLIVLPIAAMAQNKSFSERDLTSEGQKALQTLLTASQFEDTYVGYAGSLSEYVDAYRKLMQENRRIQAFKHLLAKGSIAGQLYALSGLYDTDHAYFKSVLENYKNNDTDVNTLSGCIGQIKSVKEIVFLDKPNTIRLDHPAQPFNEWVDKANLGVQGFMLDISGGGYPMMFREPSKQ